jgi:hypothetical protein
MKNVECCWVLGQITTFAGKVAIRSVISLPANGDSRKTLGKKRFDLLWRTFEH